MELDLEIEGLNFNSVFHLVGRSEGFPSKKHVEAQEDCEEGRLPEMQLRSKNFVALFMCRHTQSGWNKCGISRNNLLVSEEQVPSWVSSQVKKRVMIVSIILWMIWHAQNTQIFKGKEVTTAKTYTYIQVRWIQLKEAFVRSGE